MAYSFDAFLRDHQGFGYARRDVEGVLREQSMPAELDLTGELDRIFGADDVINGETEELRALFDLIDDRFDDDGIRGSVQAPNSWFRLSPGQPAPDAPRGSAGWSLLRRVSATAQAGRVRAPSRSFDVTGLGTTLGLRNNNPWNIKGGGWEGGVGTDERGHMRFDDAAYSARAAAYQLMLYYTGESEAAGRRELRTLEQIFRTYAPASDTVGSLPGRPQNDPDAYANWVAEQMGIRPDEDIQLTDGSGRIDPAVAVPLLDAIARYESGRSLELPAGLIEEGIRRLPERWAP